MRIAIINSTCGVGSTGKICVSISKLLTANMIDNKIFYTQDSSDYELSDKYSNSLYKKIQSFFAKALGIWGFTSLLSTAKLIYKLKCFKPDIINIHNIHSHDCNLTFLFRYIKNNDIPVVWTFHDCWAFTGYCTHFICQQCFKWQTSCYSCEQRKRYSWIFDKSKVNFKKKKKCIDEINLTVVAPSSWIASLVKQSFFSDKTIEIINNGIDLSVFRYVKSDIRERIGISKDCILVLGVAYKWSYRKGIDVFERLANELPDNYKIVLVGRINSTIASKLSRNIICIERTNNQKELAEYYSAADVFVNPTREENFPTVHLESIACGTPVVSFDTGGCKEMLNRTNGIVVSTDDYDGLKDGILTITKKSKYHEQHSINVTNIDENFSYKIYLKLFKRLFNINKGKK